MTWVLIAWSVACAIWLGAGAQSQAAHDKAYCTAHAVPGFLSVQDCINARQTGTGIADMIIIVFWAIVFGALSLVWIMSRPKPSAPLTQP